MHPDDPRAIWESVPVGDRSFRIRRPPSAEDLISEDEFADDERLPYWAEVWPSGRVLTGVIAQMDLTGRSVIELGAGIGTGAMVAAMRGATALATDWYPAAVEFSRWNAANLGLGMDAIVMDWRDPPDAVLDRAPFDLVIGADILYEQRNGVALGALIPHLVGPQSEVLIVDPRRPDARPFVDAMRAAGWSHTREDLPVPGRVDETGSIAHVHRFAPPTGRAHIPVVI
ncbi:MAG: methyltransferase domain-containing protein [Thermoleophilia bacterium]|nr:methyltransferase domain-containing protein [Thermoleophilia bacterium]